MNDPHIQEFFLLQGIDENNVPHVLAVAESHGKLVDLSGEVNKDYNGLFRYFTITNQGGLLIHLAKRKMEAEAKQAATHEAPPSRN